MRYINQLRELVGSWVTVISIVLFLVMVFKYQKHLLHFFYILSAINSFYLIGIILISLLVPFHIVELIAPLTLSFLMNAILGLKLLVSFFETKIQLNF